MNVLAGKVAANAMRGDLPITHRSDIGCETALVLDMRTAGEVTSDPMPCGKHIPIDELRTRLDELPRDKPIQVVCGVGIRAYNAICLLRQHGCQASLLSGGVSTGMHFQSPRAGLHAALRTCGARLVPRCLRSSRQFRR